MKLLNSSAFWGLSIAAVFTYFLLVAVDPALANELETKVLSLLP